MDDLKLDTLALLDQIECQTAQELFNSLAYHSTVLSLTHPIPFHLKRADVIEIQGPPSSGKSHLLYEITITCILPNVLEIVTDGHVSEKQILNLCGWEKSAILIDTDGRWDISRFHDTLIHRLKTLFPQGVQSTHPTIEEVASLALKNLHIFRVTSSASLAATLVNLPSYHEQHIPSSEIALLMIDSMSAFYWSDRYFAEKIKLSKENISSLLGQVLIAIQDFRLLYGPVIVITNWGLSLMPENLRDENVEDDYVATPVYRQHLHPFPAPFEQSPRNLLNANSFPPITHHFTLLPKPLLSQTRVSSSTEKSVLVDDETIDAEQIQIFATIRTFETGSTKQFIFKWKP